MIKGSWNSYGPVGYDRLMKDMIIEEFTFVNSMPDLFEHAKNLVLRMNTNAN